MAKTKIKDYWHMIPKEVRVLLFVGLSGFLTAVSKELKNADVQNLLVMGLINIGLVLLKERVPELRDRFKK